MNFLHFFVSRKRPVKRESVKLTVEKLSSHVPSALHFRDLVPKLAMQLLYRIFVLLSMCMPRLFPFNTRNNFYQF